MRWGLAAAAAVVSALGSAALVADDTVAGDTVALAADAPPPAFAPVAAATVVRRVRIESVSRLAMLSSTSDDSGDDSGDERGFRGRQRRRDWRALSSATDSDLEWRLHSRADARVFPEGALANARRPRRSQHSASDSDDYIPKYAWRRSRKQPSASDSDDYKPKYAGRRRQSSLSASDSDSQPNDAPIVHVHRLGVGGDHTGTVVHVRARAVLPVKQFVPKKANGASRVPTASPGVVRRTVEPRKVSSAVPDTIALPSSTSSGDELSAHFGSSGSLVSAARAFQRGGRLDAIGKRLAIGGGAQTLSAVLGLRAPGDRTAVIFNDAAVLKTLQAALGLGAAPAALRLDVGVLPGGGLDVAVQAVFPEAAPRAREWLADVATAALCAPDEFPVLAGTTGAYRLRDGVVEALSEPLPAFLVDVGGIIDLLTSNSGNLAIEDGVSDSEAEALRLHTGLDDYERRSTDNRQYDNTLGEREQVSTALTGRKRRTLDDTEEDGHQAKRVMRSVDKGEDDQHSTLPTTVAAEVAHSGGETAVETGSGTHVLSRITSALLADAAATAGIGLAGVLGLATQESVVGAVLVTAIFAARILPAVLFPRR